MTLKTLREQLRRLRIVKYFEKYIDARIDHYIRYVAPPDNVIEQRLRNEAGVNQWELFKILGVDKFEKNIDGVRFCFYTDSLISYYLFLGQFENAEIAFMKKFLNEGDVFIDIGANIGLFTIMAGRKVGSSGKVYAFEPVSKTYERLNENISLNKFSNCLSFHLALSNQKASMTINTPQGWYDAHSTLTSTPSRGEGDMKTEQIEASTIDILISQYREMGLAALIKIDVEGWERYVLEGGADFFRSKNAPTLMVEFADDNLQSLDGSCAQLYEQLVEYGYNIYKYDASANLLMPSPRKEVYGYENLIASKNISEVQRRINM